MGDMVGQSDLYERGYVLPPRNSEATVSAQKLEAELLKIRRKFKGIYSALAGLATAVALLFLLVLFR